MLSNQKHKIGDTIAKLRKAKGWTQIELAEKLQVSDKAVSKWESNKGAPSIEFLPAIAELFDVTLDYLMTGKEQVNDFNTQMGAVDGKKNAKLNKTELAAQYTKNGIVDIAVLMESKDPEVIKEVLSTQPIHDVELLYHWLKDKKMKELFRYAVDNKLDKIARLIMDGATDEIDNELVNIFKKNPAANGQLLEIRNHGLNVLISKFHLSIEMIIQYLMDYKQQLITDVLYEFDKQKAIQDLTEDYFKTELAKGNYEMVIIKLCVRLEAILRYEYGYTGEFSEMLEDYCKSFKTQDTPRLLQKLRMQRNSIVHSDKSAERLTIQELQSCINYICGLGTDTTARYRVVR